MTSFEDIYQFFRNPPPFYLNKELAVCYVLAILLRKDSYGTELIQLLESEYPSYRLSDTVLYSALKFLEDKSTITGYWKKVEGRGRPRRMYQVCSEWQREVRALSHLWEEYVSRNTPKVLLSIGVDVADGHELDRKAH
ncbi:MAG: helix-turn-helix transcriptional regulator [Cyanothece sp. SIO2G6]|nr:helix-turn-helix transcriptional regulator [Cyanothece sp. SIO2G6]